MVTKLIKLFHYLSCSVSLLKLTPNSNMVTKLIKLFDYLVIQLVYQNLPPTVTWLLSLLSYLIT